MENIIKSISSGLKLRYLLGVISTFGLSYLITIFIAAQEKDIFNKLWDAYKIIITI